MTRLFSIVLFLLVCNFSFAQDDKKNRWVDSVFKSLSQSEKIGQLLMTPLSSNLSREEIKSATDLTKANKISGFFITQSSPLKFSNAMNSFQAQSKIALLTGANITNGLGSVFDSVMTFYDTLVLSAVANDTLKKNLKNELSRQIEIMGIRLNINSAEKSFGNLKFLDVRQSLSQSKLKKGEGERQALIAGNDLLLVLTSNVDVTIKATVKSLKKDKSLAFQIDSSVKKVLSLKYESGLFQNKFIDTDNLFKRLHSAEALLLKQKIAEESVTVVQNSSDLIPIRTLDDKTFASISIGSTSQNNFTTYLSKYAWFRHHSILNISDTTGIDERVKDKDIIVIGLFAHTTQPVIDKLKKLSLKHKVIVCSFIDPLELKSFEGLPSLIEAYSNDNEIQQAAAEIIFGSIEAKGKLPITISDSLIAGKSILTKRVNRFAYELPEAAGMDSNVLNKIESIANEAITIGSTPGLNVLVAKDGKVVYEKSFGSLTYDKKSPVSNETIFDLASITKVSATLQTVMYMQEKGLIDINKKASVYLPELKGTNKEDFIIKDILTHQAGLWPFLPFWAETVKDTSVWKKYYSKIESDEFPFPVAENMFAAKSMKDSLWQWIIKAKIREKPARTVFDYRYSDMGFYIMQHLAEKMLGMSMEDFLQKNIYRPLGAYTTSYLPLKKFSAAQIAPTEKDTLFRKSLLIGYVHDQGAAMHGGVAGHAGLFSNANDLAKLGQMWLNKGSYGGVTFFKPETIELFTAKQYETSRRGLGWDRPLINEWNGPTSIYASAKTFGHTGFTGTSIWVDPEFNLVFVFLSNRVYPDMNNTKILNANIRPRIQDVVYQSIFEYCRNHNSH